METLVFFLAIGAIQLIASYMKQKKEREKAPQKAQQAPQRSTQTAPQSSPRRPPPEASSPVPDPLREIMRQLGVPVPEAEPVVPPPVPRVESPKKQSSASSQEHFDGFEERPIPVRELIKAVPVDEIQYGKRQAALPMASMETGEDLVLGGLGDLGGLGHSIEDSAHLNGSRNPNGIRALLHPKELKAGIIWAAVLQEPRFRKPWMGSVFR